MTYRYTRTHPDLRIEQEVRERIEGAAAHLHDKLAVLDPSRLDISDYNRRCMAIARDKSTGSLQLACDAMQFTLAGMHRRKSDIGFIDYGGGWGGLSLLAKELGFGTVVFNDIYDVSCRDARTIARAIGLEAHHYCCGDFGDLGAYLQEKNLSAQIIASQSVIEHIYDIEEFFRQLAMLPCRLESIFMSTHANQYNPIIRYLVERDQRQVELFDRQPEPGHKERDSLRSYRSIREEIVNRTLQDAGREPTAHESAILAERFRGRTEADIVSALQRYLIDGILPDPDPYPYNTCDPKTGNWCEHFMNPRRLAAILTEGGYQARVINIPFVHDPNPLRRLVQIPLNALCRLAGSRGIDFAYQYAIHGTRESPS